MKANGPSGVSRYQVPRVMGALIVREMITRYGRSWGGYAWALAEPLGMLLILSTALSQLVHQPAYGKSFLLFYATGYLPFYFFTHCSEQAGSAVGVNRELMQLPGVTPLAAIFARYILTLITLTVVGTIILIIVALTLREPLRFNAGHVLEAIACASLLGLGIGLVNTVLFAFLPMWRQVWGLIRMPLMILSGVFYTFSSMPAHIQSVLWWNPIIHCVGAMRGAFFTGYRDDYVSFPYVIGVSAALIVTGLALLARHQYTVIEAK